MTDGINHSCSVRLLEALTAKGVVSATNRQVVQGFMQTWDVSAYHGLLLTKLLAEEELADALAMALKLPRVYHFVGAQLDLVALSVIDFNRARGWECLPIKGPDGGLVVVFADASRSDRISEIKQGLKQEFTLAVATLSATLKAIDELYPLAAQLPSLYGR
jgi:hypothetical protein